MSWTCLQLGSREHYAVPAALHAEGQLEALITDCWVGRRMADLLRFAAPSLAGRRNKEIPDALVRERTLGRVLLDRKLRGRRTAGWQAVMERNRWFGEWAAGLLPHLSSRLVFSYSYTAREPFRQAAGLGKRKVLDQIDGAWREEQVWRELSAAYHGLEAEIDQAPALYWEQWREELELADVIVVNSGWSRRLIVEAGAEEAKIVEIPLVYAPARPAGDSLQPSVFSMSGCQHVSVSRSRPRLRALFLGNVVLRKGVGQLLDAIRMIRNEPVDFTFAGPVGVNVPDDVRAMPNVRFLGAVDRATAEQLYGDSDVFLFPTLSDGFGRTQLEALGHGCPVIASTRCASVVEDRVNGILLREVTPQNIADAIMELVRDRDLLSDLKSRAVVPDRFHPRHLAPALLALAS